MAFNEKDRLLEVIDWAFKTPIKSYEFIEF